MKGAFVLQKANRMKIYKPIKDQIAPFVFIAPAIMMLIVLSVVPILYSFGLSLFKYNLAKPASSIRCLFVLLFVLCGSALAETQHDVRYYYRNYCESCTPEEDFAEQFQQLTSLDLNACSYTAFNVVHADGNAAFLQEQEQLGLKDALLPMVVVDGTAYQGAGEMNTDLAENALTWNDSQDSVIVYLYTPACESCAQASAVLESLPSSVTVKRGDISFESPVTVERIDASANTALADALFEAYAVSDEDRITPAVFFGEYSLSGADAIEHSLASMVELGWAVGGIKDVDVSTSTRSDVLSVFTTIGSGLVAGLNTCALSMLLLFLSVVFELREHAAGCVICFLATKFVCYLLIGFALLNVLQHINPHWLRPVARILLTTIGGILMIGNVWDALQIRREQYGKIRNQLPLRLRRLLHRAIKAFSARRLLYPSAILLGFIVGLGEFLCAGQLYLMRLLNAVQMGDVHAAAILPVYCLSFIAPSAVLSVLALCGQSQMRLSAFLAERMLPLKLLTAAAMLALILISWLL